MANLRCVVNIPQATYNATTTYNIACCAGPADQIVCVTGYGIFGGYNAAATPGLLQFARASSQGSSGTAMTVKVLTTNTLCTPRSSWIGNPSTPPSSIVVMDSRLLNPQLGLTELWDQDNWIEIDDSLFFVVQFTPGQTTTYSGWIRICE